MLLISHFSPLPDRSQLVNPLLFHPLLPPPNPVALINGALSGSPRKKQIPSSNVPTSRTIWQSLAFARFLAWTNNVFSYC